MRIRNFYALRRMSREGLWISQAGSRSITFFQVPGPMISSFCDCRSARLFYPVCKGIVGHFFFAGKGLVKFFGINDAAGNAWQPAKKTAFVDGLLYAGDLQIVILALSQK